MKEWLSENLIPMVMAISFIGFVLLIIFEAFMDVWRKKRR